MKINIFEKTTEIECNAEELRNSNSLADNISGMLRSIFRPVTICSSANSAEDDEEQEGEE